MYCNTPMFYIAAIFVKYFYKTGSWLFWLISKYALFGCSSLGHSVQHERSERISHSEAKIKWSPFGRRHFPMDFLVRKLLQFDIRTLHDCPTQMNENLLISNSKLTSDSELIWLRWSTNLSSFVRDSHAGCVLYNGKDNHHQIRSWIQIMQNVRVLSNHERALL